MAKASKHESPQADGALELTVHDPVAVDLSKVQFAPYNPRVMPPAKMAALKASLRKHGVVLNLVVQKRSAKYGEMVLIGGHQRVRAMRELCAEMGKPEITRSWAVVLDVDDAKAMQLNVSLNNIEGEFDPYKLGEMFKDISSTMLPDDFLAVGFNHSQVDDLVALITPIEVAAETLENAANEIATFAKSVSLSVEFATVEQRDEAKALLEKLAKGREVKPGELLLETLKAYATSSGAKKAPKNKA